MTPDIIRLVAAQPPRVEPHRDPWLMDFVCLLLGCLGIYAIAVTAYGFGVE